MTKSKWRGNKIIFIDDEWVYADTGEPVEINPNRPCGHCGKESTPEGYDGCIGHIPAVMNACCGHGRIKDMYVQFNDKRRIGGLSAYFWLRRRYLIGRRKRKLLKWMYDDFETIDQAKLRYFAIVYSKEYSNNE